jgi:hypothetical protein
VVWAIAAPEQKLSAAARQSERNIRRRLHEWREGARVACVPDGVKARKPLQTRAAGYELPP